MTNSAYQSFKKLLHRAPRRADEYHQALETGQLCEAVSIYCQWSIYRTELIYRAHRLEQPLTGDIATSFERYKTLLPLASAQTVKTCLQTHPCGLNEATDRSRPARLVLRDLRVQAEGHTAST